MAKQGRKQDSTTKLANSLTPEQYSRLLDIAFPITEEERNMSVDELARELSEYEEVSKCQ